MNSTERRQRRLRIASDLDGAGYTAQAAAIRSGNLLPRVTSAGQRAAVEAIYRRHGVEIAHTWGERRPLRRVDHRLGASGNGWWLPNGDVVTWPAAASHATKLDTLGVAPDWLPRYDQALGRYERGDELAVAFTITPTGWLEDELGEPLGEEQRAAVAAAIVLAFAESQYCRFGLLHQARFEPNPYTESLTQLAGEDHRVGVARLLYEGELHRWHGPRVAFQLPALVRATLIGRYELGRSWQFAPGGPGYDPNDDRFGEIACAHREAGEEREQRHEFVVASGPAGDQREVAVQIAVEQEGEQLWLSLRWEPSRPSPSHASEPTPGARRVQTRVAVDASERVRVAVLRESERLVRNHVGRGRALGRICDWLGRFEQSWLSGQAPPFEP